MNVIAGWISPLAVAAWAVTLNVLALVFMVPLGLSTATAVLVGRAYGARDRAGLRRAAVVGFAVTARVRRADRAGRSGRAVAPIARALHRRPADRRAGRRRAGALRGLLLPDGLQVVVAQALRARGDVLVPTLTHLTSYILVMLPLAWWLAIPLGWGIAGIAWAIIIAAYISAGLLAGAVLDAGAAGLAGGLGGDRGVVGQRRLQPAHGRQGVDRQRASAVRTPPTTSSRPMPAPGPAPTSQATARQAGRAHRRLGHPVGQRPGDQEGERHRQHGDLAHRREHPPLHVGRDLGLEDRGRRRCSRTAA